MFAPLLMLVACSPTPDALPDSALPPAASIVLAAPDQLFLGQVNTFTVTGNLGQQEPVYLVGGPGTPTAGPCPRQIGYRCLDIANPVILGTGPFDGTDALIDVDVPPGVVAGDTWTFQAVVVRGRRGASSVVSAAVTATAEDYVPGCTDAGATNYNPAATYNDGSCAFAGSNPAGSVLIPTSDFTDPSPPAGWTQCGGFVNTAGDDVTTNVLNNCLNTTRLRMRVFDANNVLKDDVYATGMTSWAAWPDFNYLGGSATVVVNTYWNGSTTFFTDQGGDACNFSGYNTGFSLGNGNANTLNISPADNDPAKEIRINCNGAGLLGHKVALYR